MISCLKNFSANDRIALFGEAFVNVEMLSVSVENNVMHTVVMLDGRKTTLVGDPEKALAVYRQGRTQPKRGILAWLKGLL